uniref:6-phosphofructokinase n=1 Tax=Coremiostelium polycephalum TaxID=142831 RepID=A0A1L2FUS6_9MYCE|nr:phosphofructokinase [Coremiostelium polycephalum]|eukprot:gene7681-9449_t
MEKETVTVTTTVTRIEKMQEPKRMAVLTSGGDSCGMNPAIRAFTRMALLKGAEVFAIREGYNGLVQDSIVKLNWGSVAGIINRGGTIIGTARSSEFRTKDGRKKAVYNLIKNKINNLLVIGGDGSLTGANILKSEWNGLLQELVDEKKIDCELLKTHCTLSVCGLVGSIDNDMCGTELTIGADTATRRILEAIDSILSTAVSHQRSFVIEVMGRNCGWLALASGLATGADYILVPECPPEDGWEEHMVENLEKGRVSGRRCSLIIVAEGAIDKKGNPITSSYVRKILEEKAGHDARITILGHVQRGGVPTYFDRYISTRMGIEAVNYFYSKGENEDEPILIGMNGNTLIRSPLMKCVKETQQIGKLISEKKFEQVVKLRGGLFEEFHDIFHILSNQKRSHVEKKNIKIAILHSGGPSPGMNPAVRAFTRLGIDQGYTVYGIFNGFAGLAKGDLKEMHWMTVNGWSVMGGAELGTNRSVPNDSNIEDILKTIEKFGIDAIVMFGGFNGYVGMSNLYDFRAKYPQLNRVSMICAPGTIANNIPGTENSIGSDTCLNNILDAIDKIKQSAVASRRLFVVEVMGAHCGYLCAMSSLTSGAERSYIMERGINIKSLTEDLNMFVERFKKEHKIGLIIKSENASETYSTHFVYELFKEEGHHLFDVRESILGHLQQGGSPSSIDRLFSTRLMHHYFKLLDDHSKNNKDQPAIAGCLGFQNGSIIFTPMEKMVKDINHRYRRPVDQWWLDLVQVSQDISVAPVQDNIENGKINPNINSPTIYSQNVSINER